MPSFQLSGKRGDRNRGLQNLYIRGITIKALDIESGRNRTNPTLYSDMRAPTTLRTHINQGIGFYKYTSIHSFKALEIQRDNTIKEIG